MDLRSRLIKHRQQEAHQRHVQERERQADLNRQDAQQRVKDVAKKTGPFAFPFGGGT